MRAIDKLRANWSKRARDLMLHHPLGQSTKSDGHYLSGVLGPLMDELDRRGYDKTTIKFSIEPKQGNDRFASQRDDPSW